MFSPMEVRVIEKITAKPISIADLTDIIYPKDKPLEAGNYIAGVVRRIRNKCIHNKLSWSIESKGGGRGGVMVYKVQGEKNENKRTTKRVS